MKILLWASLSASQKTHALARPAILNSASISQSVEEIIQRVQKEGDAALIHFTEQFDKQKPKHLNVSQEEIKNALNRINPEIKEAIENAYKNIFAFHLAQKSRPFEVETMPGVLCGLLSRPIEKVGLYIPGGSAPLLSTALMLGIPAHIAGCKKTILCSPPPICDEILYIATRCQIDEIYNLGGAQAIAALAYGTESVPKVDKIFGPGNSYVTQAKERVSQDIKGAAIDMPAGPSELLIIAETGADPDFIAADLLSQAEHGLDSQVILLTPSMHLAKEVARAVKKQLKSLSRAQIANKSLEKSRLIVMNDVKECIDISNYYAPEHLIIQTQNPRECLNQIENAGSVFLGAYSPESVGDYASGTNHVLPTYGHTKTLSSLGLSDFTKRMSVQELTPEGLQSISSTVMVMAQAEGLDAHKNAVTVRLNKLKKR